MSEDRDPADEGLESVEAAEEGNRSETSPQVDAAATAEAEEVAPAEVAEVAAEFVGGLLEAIGMGGEVTTSLEGERATVDITGEDLGALIGRRGQTLDALQEVTRTAVQRRLRSRVRLLVDVEGYRARRRESLAEYARAMARRAQTRGTEIELEAMNAYERKVVHDSVAEIAGALSFSEGEEPDRRVIIRGE